MPYTAEISRARRSCILFVIDQSASMEDAFGGDPSRRKMQGVADAVNRLLHTLILRCATADGVKHAYDLGVVGYGRETHFGFGGRLAGRELAPINEVADSPVRIEERSVKVEDGAGGLVTQVKKIPIWFDPVADGATPMAGALEHAHRILSAWLPDHSTAFPPIVIHITDGDATDGDPLPKAQALQQLSTADGSVLLFNCHLSDHAAQPIEFPAAEDGLPDDFAKRLFRMSSVLPSRFREEASAEGHPIAPQSRGFVFNADLVQLIGFLDIGTRASNLR
jgi:hypothetical protein